MRGIVGHERELCWLLNMTLVQDAPALAHSVAGISRALNRSLCTTRGNSALSRKFPREGVTYRGGGFGIAGHATLSPPRLKAFFTPGKRYRQPAFMATSFAESTAREFVERAAAAEHVLWVVRADPRGDWNHPEHREEHRCKHVNYVSNSHIVECHANGAPVIDMSTGQPKTAESEYLYQAYSVFTVGGGEDPFGVWAGAPPTPAPTWTSGTKTDPHIIHLVAASDNRVRPDDEHLPLAPWF